MRVTRDGAAVVGNDSLWRDGVRQLPVVNIPLLKGLEGEADFGDSVVGITRDGSHINVRPSSQRLLLNPENTRDCVALAFDSQLGHYVEARGQVTNSCLRSRAFDTSPWARSVTVVQDETGYDGVANKAWSVTDSAAVDQNMQQGIAVSANQTHVICVYIKKTTGTPASYPGIRARFSGVSTTWGGAVVDPTAGVASRTGNIASVSVSDMGNFWRVVATATDTGGNSLLTVYFTPAYASSYTTTFDATAQGTHVFDQVDVFLNSTTASGPIETEASAVTVYGATRFEREGMLIEQEIANSCLQSRDFDQSPWNTVGAVLSQDQVGIDGTANTAWTIEDDNASASEYIYQTVTIPNDSNTHTVQYFIKKDSDTSRYPYLRVSCIDGTAIDVATIFNTATGACSNSAQWSSELRGDYWRLTTSITNNASGNVRIAFYFYPARSTDFVSLTNAATGSAVLGQVDVFLDSAIAYNPIFTTTAAETKTADLVRYTMTDEFKALFETSYGTAIIDDDCSADNTGDWAIAYGTLAFATDHYTLTQTGSGPRIYRTVNVIGGQLYRFSAEFQDGTATGVSGFIRRSSNDWLEEEDVNFVTNGTWQEVVMYTYASATELQRWQIRGLQASGNIKIRNIKVEPVTDLAQGTVVLDVVFGHDTDITRSQYDGLLTIGGASTGLMYFGYAYGGYTSINLRSYDQTAVASHGIDTPEPGAGDTVRLFVKFGYIDSNVLKHRAGSQRGSSAVAWGTAQDFDGAFALSTYMELFRGGFGNLHVRNLQIYDCILSDDAIRRL